MGWSAVVCCSLKQPHACGPWPGSTLVKPQEHQWKACWWRFKDWHALIETFRINEQNLDAGKADLKHTLTETRHHASCCEATKPLLHSQGKPKRVPAGPSAQPKRTRCFWCIQTWAHSPSRMYRMAAAHSQFCLVFTTLQGAASNRP